MTACQLSGVFAFNREQSLNETVLILPYFCSVFYSYACKYHHYSSGAEIRNQFPDGAIITFFLRHGDDYIHLLSINVVPCPKSATVVDRRVEASP